MFSVSSAVNVALKSPSPPLFSVTSADTVALISPFPLLFSVTFADGVALISPSPPMFSISSADNVALGAPSTSLFSHLSGINSGSPTELEKLQGYHKRHLLNSYICLTITIVYVSKYLWVVYFQPFNVFFIM